MKKMLFVLINFLRPLFLRSYNQNYQEMAVKIVQIADPDNNYGINAGNHSKLKEILRYLITVEGRKSQGSTGEYWRK